MTSVVAWNHYRVSTKRYALRLMIGLMSDVEGMHDTNTEGSESSRLKLTFVLFAMLGKLCY